MKKLSLFFTMVMLIGLVMLAACSKDSTGSDLADQSDIEKTDPSTENHSNEEDITEVEEQDEQPVEEDPAPTTVKNHQVVLYFSDNELMDIYRVEQEVEVKQGDQVAMSALTTWINGPEHEELTGLINSEVTIEYLEEVDGIAHVSFSNEILNSNLGSSGELMLVEQIAMLMQQFGFDQTQILVEGNVSETLFDHFYTGDPIVANDPESYLWADDMTTDEIVLQNEAFRIYQPAPHAEVRDRIVVRGSARVFEGTIVYEFEDGHFILDEGFTTATGGAPEWGAFEIIIELDDVTDYTGTIILFEESAQDGSRINELQIPVYVID
ncbi:Gmad2 immunoglobulin-like domain-containing protein [Virgibacillus byunsanensis]|uniref:Gmad2 immunoglobulin-like domain-containing protein n=1 Tax=Virgibacillus byunsanensis TaxID=570945 RepID=A0ABW3LQR5_9BACI